MPLFAQGEPSPSELEARLRLHSLPKIGPVHFHLLISAFGSASSALSAPASAWASLRLPSVSAQARRCEQVRETARASMAWLEQPGQHLLMWDDPLYPALLAEISDPPPLLFIAGNLNLLDKPQLAVIGSRRASRPGLDTATAFAKSLARAGFVITSGLAAGVDGAAHQGALEGGGATIAVLGTGLEKLYPQRHKRLAQAILEQGSALVSEFPLATEPAKDNFPRRNRIISGLSLGVLVVEASLASGSLITARLAAEQGREVFAMPGSIHHPGAKGCHQLIRDGAVLVESIDHILEALRGWQAVAPPGAGTSASREAPRDPLYKLLLIAPHSAEALVASLGWPISRVLMGLTELEMAGHAVCDAGRWAARPLA